MKYRVKNLLFTAAIMAGLSTAMTGRVMAQTWNLATLHSFSTTVLAEVGDDNSTNGDGAMPEGPLCLSGTVLYGATLAGGVTGDGAIFSLKTDGQGFATLHSLKASTDGSKPQGGLVLTDNALFGVAQVRGKENFGTIYTVEINGSGFKVLHNFMPTVLAVPDGFNPSGTLSVSGSTLYGTALSGGNGGTFNGEGMVFSIGTSGKNYKNVKVFGGPPTDPEAPGTGVIMTNGTLYGTSFFGGDSDFLTVGAGTVFAVNTNGGANAADTILYNFTNGTDGGLPAGGLVLSGSRLYGMTEEGGLFNHGTVYAVDTNGSNFRVLYSFSAETTNAAGVGTNSDGAGPIGALVLSDGILFGVTTNGGSGGSGTIFALDPSNSNFTNLYSFSALTTNALGVLTNGDGACPQGLISAGNSTFYGVTQAGGPAGNGTVFRLLFGTATAPLLVTTTSLPGGLTGVAYNQTLTASGGLAPYSWTNLSKTFPKGLSLSPSGVISGTPTASGAFNFTVMATDGLSDSATQALTLTIIVPDTTKPTVTITAPKNDAKWSNGVYTVIGTAKDNVAVTNVLLSVNGGTWMAASLDNGSWSADINLQTGNNVILAYAVDSSGNLSKTNTVNLDYILSAQITVNVSGLGTLKPNYNGEHLAISNSYTMKATPAKGFGFFFWNIVTDTSTNLSNNPSLTFTMVTNLVITANFQDITAPTITIALPKANAKESNATVNVSGTAMDNFDLAGYGVRINGSNWITGIVSGTAANWAVDNLPVQRGNNILDAYAMDAAGNISKTNSINFTGELPPDWAPVSIVESTVLVTPDSGDPITVSFGTNTFSQTDTNGPGDSGTGSYAYSQLATNLANLQVTLLSPTNKGTQDILLNFTNLNAGTFSNLDSADLGTFSIVPAATLLPSSWTGHTFTATDVGDSTTTVKITSKTELTVTESGSSTTENYVVTNASPNSAMFVVTDPQSGKTTYFQPTFFSKTGGNYEVNNFLSDGSFKDNDYGIFTFK